MSAPLAARLVLAGLVLGTLALEWRHRVVSEGAELWIVPLLGLTGLALALAVWRASASKPQRR